MAHIVFNIAKGRVVELYNRVKNNDPANSAIVLIPIETAGLQSDATLIDMDDVAAILAGATNEQATMGRKVLTDSDLAALPSPDDANDRYDIPLPTVLWTAAAGNPISKMLVAYDPDTTGGSDSNLLPLTMFDCPLTPDSNNFELTSGNFYRAS